MGASFCGERLGLDIALINLLLLDFFSVACNGGYLFALFSFSDLNFH